MNSTEPLLQKSLSSFSAVPVGGETPGAAPALQYAPVRDPAFVPADKSMDAGLLCCGKRLLALAVVVAIGFTLVNVGRSVFRKPRGGAS